MMHVLWSEPFTLTGREVSLSWGYKVLCREAGVFVKVKQFKGPSISWRQVDYRDLLAK